MIMSSLSKCLSLGALAAAVACGQTAPRIGILDFYGLHKVQDSKLRQALGVREGDPLPASKGDAEDRLDAVSGVAESHLEAVCCEDGKMILYVGIEERGAPHFDLREPPEGDAQLPPEISAAYGNFLQAFESAVRRGETGEDLTKGHSLMADPATRAIQETFPELARDNLTVLRSVLRNGQDAGERAAAAFVIAYAPHKADIVNDLQYGLKDADSSVRSNATRGLVALSVLARLDPESGLKISPTWFIEMLNSVSWTDRNKSSLALVTLTEARDPAVLAQLKERAQPALVEMAGLKTLGHALPAVVLLGRIAGWSEEQIQDAWSRGDRAAVIAAATGQRQTRGR